MNLFGPLPSFYDPVVAYLESRWSEDEDKAQGPDHYRPRREAYEDFQSGGEGHKKTPEKISKEVKQT